MTWPTLPTRTADGAEVVTFGEAMTLLRAETGIPLRSATRFERDVAGAETNVAIGLARLGVRVSLTLRLGNDAFGEAVAGACRAEGIALRVVTDDHRPTGLLIRDVLADRPIEVVYHRSGSAASALEVTDLPLDDIAPARVLHVSGITPLLSLSAAEATRAAVIAARDGGTMVSFDPNLRRRRADPATAVACWAPIIEHSDIVLASVDEAEVIAGTTEPDAIASSLHERGVGVVVVKDGAAGCWASEGHGIIEQPAFDVRCVDPVGAGDAFAAGFLFAVLDNRDVPEALLAGSAVAACAVQVAGDIAGLPTRRHLDQLLRDAHSRDVLR
ncbi:sugar kinase [soil metagenome]